MSIPASLNESNGFYGTMGGLASVAWPLAMQSIADATRQPMESVRAFLDSVSGRHFGDTVQNALCYGHPLDTAVIIAVGDWIERPVRHADRVRFGIQRGECLLTGLVIHSYRFR